MWERKLAVIITLLNLIASIRGEGEVIEPTPSPTRSPTQSQPPTKSQSPTSDILIKNCKETLDEYDYNGNGVIDRNEEFVTFLEHLSGNTEYDGGTNFIDVDLDFIGVLNEVSSESEGLDLSNPAQVLTFCTLLAVQIKNHRTEHPSFLPSLSPAPSDIPTQKPTTFPVAEPSSSPTSSPSKKPTTMPTFSPTFNPSVSPEVSPSQMPTVSPSTAPSCLAKPYNVIVRYPLTSQAGLNAAAIINGEDNTVKADLLHATINVTTSFIDQEYENQSDVYYDETHPPNIDSVLSIDCDVDDLEYAEDEDVNCFVVTSSITVFVDCVTDTNILEENIGEAMRQSMTNNGFCSFM